MLKTQLLIQIKNLIQSEDTTYQPIAQFIYQNSNKIGIFNTSYLATKTNSSPATITRFCKSLGLTGYKELVSILMSNQEAQPNELNKHLLNDSLKVQAQINEIIVDTAYLIDEEHFFELINDLINSPEKFLLLGYGESGQFLRMFASRMLRLGIQIRFFSQLEDMEVATSLVDDQSIILALSLSGSTKMVLDFVNICKAKKAKIYSITKFESNPLKKLSDINFSISYDKSNLLISKFPRYAIFFMLDLIFEKIVSLNPEKYLPILEKTR